MEPDVHVAPPRSASLPATSIADLPLADLDRLIGPERREAVIAVLDWMTRHSRVARLPADTIPKLCDMLVDLGVPLDRYGSSIETLDAQHDAVGRLWVRGRGLTERTYVHPNGVDADNDETYLRSPYYRAASTRRWVELWLPATDDAEFDIVAELKAEGFVHYLCVPLVLVNGTNAWTTFATKRPTGFSTADLATIARILPTIAIVIDFRSTWVALQTLLRTYVGTEPQQAILRGNTKRGQVSTITSAMLFADMRDSVGQTADLSAEQAVSVFNMLFDCLVPPIEARGGEILKYLGDGLLAIFREGDESASRNAAQCALEAAEAIFRTIEIRNGDHPEERPLKVGIALHYGEAAYGNVGSGVRLDFTVIGRDVGLASRIAGMNRTLGEPLLMSAAFVAHLREPVLRLGAYPARGFKDAVEVFRPSQTGRAAV